MVKLISGKMGSGKTKKIIKMANEMLDTTAGNIVFIDDDKRHMYDLKHDLRFISMDEYPVRSKDEFVGFVCGVISNDYDIEYIYVDGLFKVMKLEHQEMPELVNRLEEISNTFDINFVLTASCDSLPPELNDYVIE